MRINRIETKERGILFTLSFPSKSEFDEIMKGVYRLAAETIDPKYLNEYTELAAIWKERGNQLDSEYFTFIYEKEVPEFLGKMIYLVVEGSLCLDETREYINEQEKAFAQQEQILQKQMNYITSLKKDVSKLNTERNKLQTQLNEIALGLMPSDPMSH